jgi:hypothetical protein
VTTPPASTHDEGPGVRRPRWYVAAVAGVLALAGALVGGYAIAGAHHRHAAADAGAMADRAASVMPFDLNATTHTFTKTDTGGVEQVVANDPADQRNVFLIREHLLTEADRFAQGDYTDPAAIHGAAMPGLQELVAGAERVQVRYEQVPSGARITYSSADAVLVAALHAWFDAQNSDHHMPGMGMGQ